MAIEHNVVTHTCSNRLKPLQVHSVNLLFSLRELV